MSEILKKIESDIVVAAKARQQFALDVLRAVKNVLHNQKIQQQGKAAVASDIDLIKIIRSEIKKRTDAAELYNKGGREELEKKERDEIVILEKYLPVAPDLQAVKEVVLKLKNELGTTTLKDMGVLTKAVIDHFGGAADGKLVSTLVKEVLTT